MKTVHNRFYNTLPKIGIRPTIDGRRNGVRESLEDMTMNLAKSVANLLTENLRHYNGEAVECVIADTCIGGVAEAAKAAEKFAIEGVGVSITVTPCWCYGSETMDMNPDIPKAVWGFNGTERPGAVYLAAVLAAHNQKGIPAFGIYGKDVQDLSDTSIPEDVQGKLLQFAKSGLVVATLKGKSYLSMGSVSMGIAGSTVNPEFFQDYLGMRNEYIDMTEFVRRIDEEIYDKEEYERALNWVKEYCPEGPDNNAEEMQRSREQKNKDWETSVKMTLIARDLMVGNPKLEELGYGEEALGHNAISAGFQGQRQWTDHFPNGDFMETILNSSFDWNGIRPPYIMATENDSLNGVTMLFGHLLTNTAQVFADVRTYWSPEAVERVTGHKPEGLAANGFIHMINSGSAALDGTGQQTKDGKPAIKPFWEITEEEAQKCLAATSWRPASTGYFRGGGFSSDFLTKGNMPVTAARLNLVKGLGPVLQIAEGYTVEIPEEVHDVLDGRTDPTWPTTWFVPNLTGEGAFQDVYTVMNNWGANHCVISYGHIGSDLITLASMLRIPVNMHNVKEEDIFRPSAWGMFGTKDPEAADYRACQNFGPLYQ
ncbi:L-fucose isomerase [Bacillus paranthracis]|uniref:L-fucose isomerase n=2 Tax=Bacillus cereus group TaxID=86661 RepID=A0A5M9GP01_9BACI|nr:MULTISPECIES: L-fucose isomerase [Bacillus]ACJ81162.1 L-fucose isomerase [Bacillus cereus AH187]EEK99942.1 L-fucose isomerase [Bacillus cereus BDRD-ST26]EJP99048.1 L-fucose isomerase [Bacillus cereus IS075]EJQ05393.1 L-fucose isomerase [Bacillus cereus AND1407]EJR18002.1 L-fucose isomerase [Bacillus cereus MSX-A12]EOO88272.1 L-fucose isomerase [Bacillus cereus IS845/00]EOO96433.1 L-fucose isomerase [Bacillus cereus IS195]KFK73112.1 L-fucose isomerase [Bacillus cereus]MRA60362.1 L-fucose